jgi:hypothetical protein
VSILARPGRGGGAIGVAAVAGEVGRGQALQQRPMRRVEVAQGDEVVGQGPGLVERPRLEGGRQRLPVDQAGLEGQQLCRHYYAIDPAAAAYYVYAYREMWDSEPEVPS